MCWVLNDEICDLKVWNDRFTRRKPRKFAQRGFPVWQAFNPGGFHGLMSER